MSPTDHVDAERARAFQSPEFADRFGHLLKTARRRNKSSRHDVLIASDGQFDAATLHRVESGRSALDESTVMALCQAYGAELTSVLPIRTPVHIADRRVVGNGLSVEFAHDTPTAVLVAYLRLLRAVRQHDRAPAIALRREDIMVLAAHLGLDGADVVDRLTTLMGATATQRHAVAVLFATGALVIGLAAGGHASAQDRSPSAVTIVEGDVAVPTPTQTPTERTATPNRVVASVVTHDPVSVESISADVVALSTAPDVEVVAAPAAAAEIVPATTTVPEIEPGPPAQGATPDAAEIVSIEAAATITESVVARRVGVPVVAEAALPTPDVNRSGCNPDASAAVLSVVIPDLGYQCPVYAGGQALIDAGFVTLVTDVGASPALATHPGDPGTLWLAGHRDTHGAPFADVPELADGALITVSSDAAEATYQVVGRAYVEVRDGLVIDASGSATSAATWTAVVRADRGGGGDGGGGGDFAPRLVLQTCEGDDFRWMIYADLV